MNQHAHSTPDKPQKPYPDFPLFAHATGRWAKKIKGRTVYFGTWDDPSGALQEYEAHVQGKPKSPRTRTTTASQDKPQKPFDEFPLFAHATGRWCKKIRGRLHYFGPWQEPQAALKRYLETRADLEAGREPRPKDGELTLRYLVNHFLTTKRHLVETSEITLRSWADYHSACGRLLDYMGKNRLVADLHPDDFSAYRKSLAKTWGPVAIGNHVQRVRTLFKHGVDAGLIEKAVRFGPGFQRPSKKTLRQARAKRGIMMFSRDEVLALLEKAGQPLRSMVLLGLNCGFGNSDVGQLPMSALDLDGGWVNFPRPKTGVNRRCPLWPETVAALREWLTVRPKPKDHAHKDLVFVTRWGGPFHQVLNVARLSEKKISPSVDSPVSKEMAKLLCKLKLKRPRLGFYCLRHGFETIGGDAKDQVAVDAIMGHVHDGNDMAAQYREFVQDARLLDVTEHIRKWLWPTPAEVIPIRVAQ